MGCSHILTVGTQGLQVNMSLIRLVDVSFKWMFSYPHCGHTEPLGGPVFKQIDGPWFQWDVFKSSLKVYRG